MSPQLTNSQKIAVLLMSLGAERAARVLEQLPPDQAARIIKDSTALGQIPHQTQRAILHEFRGLVGAQEQRQLMPSPAESPRPVSASRSATPAYLATLPPARAAELVSDESPLLAARLLSTLSAAQSTALLDCCTPDVSERIRMHLTLLPPLTPAVRARLEKAIRRKAVQRSCRAQQDGATLLREALAAQPVEIPPAPVTPSFQLADFATLETAQVREILAQVDDATLGCALRGADERLTHQLLSALSLHRRLRIRCAISTQPVTVRAIMEAQDTLLHTAMACRATPSVNMARELAHV